MSVEVVVERRQGADTADHDRHRVRVAPEALEEPHHLLVDHRVTAHAIVEIGFLGFGWQFAVQQEIAGFQEVAVLGQLLDRIAAVEQDAFVAVDVGDLQLAARRRGEAGIIGEHPGLPIQLGDVDHLRANGPFVDGKRAALVAHGERGGLRVGARFRVHIEPLGWRNRTSRCPIGLLAAIKSDAFP